MRTAAVPPQYPIIIDRQRLRASMLAVDCGVALLARRAGMRRQRLQYILDGAIAPTGAEVQAMARALGGVQDFIAGEAHAIDQSVQPIEAERAKQRHAATECSEATLRGQRRARTGGEDAERSIIRAFETQRHSTCTH